jgi:hypothetical protein
MKDGNQKEWDDLKNRLKPYTAYFDLTADKEWYLRPMSWFELIYDVQCRGKSKCDVHIDALNLKSTMEGLNVKSSFEQESNFDW